MTTELDRTSLHRSAVLAKAGVELKPEVAAGGDFDPPLPAGWQAHHVTPALNRPGGAAVRMPDPTRSCLRVQA